MGCFFFSALGFIWEGRFKLCDFEVAIIVLGQLSDFHLDLLEARFALFSEGFAFLEQSDGFIQRCIPTFELLYDFFERFEVLFKRFGHTKYVSLEGFSSPPSMISPIGWCFKAKSWQCCRWGATRQFERG